MTRTPPDTCDTLGLSLVLRGHGWIDIVIACESGPYICTVTEIFRDPVSDLLDLCRGILTNTSTSIFLHDEPGGHLMSVTRNEAQQHTMRFALFDLGGTLYQTEITGNETLLFSIPVKRKQLLGLMMAELWKGHRFMLEPSFQKSRGKVYPHDELKALNREWNAHPSLGPSFLK